MKKLIYILISMMLLPIVLAIPVYDIPIAGQLIDVDGILITGQTNNLTIILENSSNIVIFNRTYINLTIDSQSRYFEFMNVSYDFHDNVTMRSAVNNDTFSSKTFTGYVPYAIEAKYLDGKNGSFYINQISSVNDTIFMALDNATIIREGNTSWIIENQEYWNNTNANFINLNVTDGNLTVSNTAFIQWLGSEIRRVTKGWFKFLDVDNLNASNATIKNATISTTTITGTLTLREEAVNTTPELDTRYWNVDGDTGITGTYDGNYNFSLGTGDITAGRFIDMYENTVTVAKSGGDFTTIQGAIDSITDASSLKKYIVLIYPGIYNENIIGSNWIDLRGIGNRGHSTINGSTGPLYTAPDLGGTIYKLRFTLYPTTSGQEIIYVSSTRSQRRLSIENCLFQTFSSTDNIKVRMFNIDAGVIEIKHNVIDYNLSGSSVADVKIHTIFDINGDSSVNIMNNEIDMDIRDIDDSMLLFDDASTTGGDVHVMWNDIHISSNNEGAYSGTVIGFKFRATVGNLHIQNNKIVIESKETGGTGKGYYLEIDSGGGGGVIDSTSNHIHIHGFSENYWANIDVGDEVVSHFDDIVAVDGTTGAGTVTYVNSPSDGNLDVSETVTATWFNGSWNGSDELSNLYWNIDGQTGITGTYSGSYNIETTGSIPAKGSHLNIQYNNEGKLAGSPNLFFGTSAGFLSLDGDGDYVELDGTPAISFAAFSNLTIMMWVNPSQLSFEMLIHNGPANRLRIISSTIQAFEANDEQDETDYGLDFTTDEWQLITFTREATGLLKLYRNDQVGGTVRDNTGSLTLDDIGGLTNAFTGSMDEIMIFNATISDAVVTEIFNLGRDFGAYTGTDVENLLHHWNFNADATDSVGSVDGTFVDDAHIISSPQWIETDFDIISSANFMTTSTDNQMGGLTIGEGGLIFPFVGGVLDMWWVSTDSGDAGSRFNLAEENEFEFYNDVGPIWLFPDTDEGNSLVFYKFSDTGLVIEGGADLDVTGNITAENVFLPAYIFAHTNATILAVSGDWVNVTFNQEASTPKKRITHIHSDGTNDTFTIVDDGVYELSYFLEFQDSAVTPDSHNLGRLIKNGVGMEGTLFEKDISGGPQTDKDRPLTSPLILIELSAGDEIKLQFISDDSSVSLTSHRTYGIHKDTATLRILRVG